MDVQDDPRTAMRETNRIFEDQVIGRRDFAALDRVYTANARILPPGAPMVEGREAIGEFWRSAVEGMDIKAIRLITLDVEQHGDTAVEVARGEIDLAGSAVPVAIKYVVTWKREGSGWRWHNDIWNMSA